MQMMICNNAGGTWKQTGGTIWQKAGPGNHFIFDRRTGVGDIKEKFTKNKSRT
jgi:hypothetical protein